jgi:hypothetical protein
MNKSEIFYQEDEYNMILSLDSEFDILGIDEHTYKEDNLFAFHHNEIDEKPSIGAENHTEETSIDETDHDGESSSGKFAFVTPAKIRSKACVKEEPNEGKPSDLDILCGQSRSCAAHAGNQRFQDVLEKYAAKYTLVDSKHDKMALTKEIVACITSAGGRFLKQKDGRWQEISTVAARDKVSHALRTKMASRTRQQQEKAESSTASSSKGKRPSHRRRSAECRKPRRVSSESSVESPPSEVATVSFDGSDPSSSALIEGLLKTQREIFASLQKEIGAKPVDHPLQRIHRR